MAGWFASSCSSMFDPYFTYVYQHLHRAVPDVTSVLCFCRQGNMAQVLNMMSLLAMLTAEVNWLILN